jgi:ABC-type multidrug transport system ATPase subunit
MFEDALQSSTDRIVTPTLRVSGLTKRFGGLTALADASLELRAGELLGLIGPNGAGKTTFLQCTAGVVTADAGTVSLDDLPLATAHRKDVLFYLPDGVRPWPDERVAFVLEFIEGLFGPRAGTRADVVASLGLQPLLGQRVNELSRGQRKRVTVAIGLITPQPFLLLDEPFDGLDLRQSREMEAVLRAHASRGRGLCLSIHQLADAARLCDRLALLSSGRSVGEGSLGELQQKAGVGHGDIEEVFLALT